MREGQANSHTSHLLSLEKKRSITFVESESDYVINGSTSKVVVGDDGLPIREAYSKRERQIRVVGKVTFAANVAPVFDGSDKAMTIRNLIIKMKRSFVKPKYDEKGQLIPLQKHERYMNPKLVDKLEKTDAGMNQVFAWIVSGAIDLFQHGMDFGWPKDVIAETDAFNKKMDTVASFVEENLIIYQAKDYDKKLIRDLYPEKGIPLATSRDVEEAYDRYKKYCRDSGLVNVRNVNEFKTDLDKLGCFMNEVLKINNVTTRVRGYLFRFRPAVLVGRDE